MLPCLAFSSDLMYDNSIARSKNLILNIFPSLYRLQVQYQLQDNPSRWVSGPVENTRNTPIANTIDFKNQCSAIWTTNISATPRKKCLLFSCQKFHVNFWRSEHTYFKNINTKQLSQDKQTLPNNCILLEYLLHMIFFCLNIDTISYNCFIFWSFSVQLNFFGSFSRMIC